MIDSLILIFLGVVLIEMARFGGHVSANPPPSPETARKYTWRFRVYAIIAAVLTITQGSRAYIASKDAEHTQSQLSDSITALQSKVQKSENDREVDNAYLKAKLEDYKQLQDLAPALLTMAQATEGYTQKQYASSVMNKKQLLDRTEKVVGQIRELGGKCKAQEENAFEMPMTRIYIPVTREQQDQLFAEHSQKEHQALEQIRQSCIQIYRQQFMSDAAFLRRELLIRVGGDSFLLPSEKSKYIAIDGIFAGPDPIDDSADYLEALASKFRQLPPQQP